MKEVILNNRYGDTNKLIQESDNIYRFEFESPEYIRLGIITDKPNEYWMIDPPGGPMITTNDTTIKRIFKEDNQYKIEYYDNQDGERSNN